MSRLFNAIRRIEAILLAASVIAIAALIVLNVLCRALLGFSLAAAGELCQFLIVLITFTGLSHAAGSGRHIRMTAFHDLLGAGARRRLLAFVSGATALLLFVLAWYALAYVAVVHRLGSASPVLQVPLYLVYACAPLGLGAAGVQYLLALVRNLRGPGAWLSWDTRDEYTDTAAGEG